MPDTASSSQRPPNPRAVLASPQPFSPLFSGNLAPHFQLPPSFIGAAPGLPVSPMAGWKPANPMASPHPGLPANLMDALSTANPAGFRPFDPLGFRPGMPGAFNPFNSFGPIGPGQPKSLVMQTLAKSGSPVGEGASLHLNSPVGLNPAFGVSLFIFNRKLIGFK
jgi:hypothetical protein